MGLEQADFLLSEEELAKLNGFIHQEAKSFAAEGEDNVMEVSVIFDFVAVYGRSISVKYGGAVHPTVVVDFPQS